MYKDTSLVYVQADLRAVGYGIASTITNNCSTTEQTFLDQILHSIKSVHMATKRLVAFHHLTGLIECDTDLRRLYTYKAGKPPTMNCPRVYNSSIQECKVWALKNCNGISPDERVWLRPTHCRPRRSSFFYHMGFFNLGRTFYEASGEIVTRQPPNYLLS